MSRFKVTSTAKTLQQSLSISSIREEDEDTLIASGEHKLRHRPDETPLSYGAVKGSNGKGESHTATLVHEKTIVSFVSRLPLS